MKSIALTVVAATLGASSAAFATHPAPEPRQICREIRAVIHELKTDIGCASPLNFCSAGTINGNFGLKGTTFFSVDGSAETPAQSPGTSSFSGVFTITTPYGELTLRETGLSYPRRGNPEGGLVATIDEVTGGTGIYAHTSGILFFHGRNGRGLPSDVEVSGTLCYLWPVPRQ
ncbi:MAG TPA: hypothetical protein VMF52_15200 [Steroidobacteraceae bacterium]|nr:hypothetical protein [Steroidobacteraceae bacterium]